MPVNFQAFDATSIRPFPVCSQDMEWEGGIWSGVEGVFEVVKQDELQYDGGLTGYYIPIYARHLSAFLVSASFRGLLAIQF